MPDGKAKQLLKANCVGDDVRSRRPQVTDYTGEDGEGSADSTIYDLVVRGGRLVDLGGGWSGDLDVGVVGDRIEAVGADLRVGRDTEIIDATMCLVVPGLVDLHTHVFPDGTFWGVDPEPVAWRTGVTTFVDAGSAGAFSADALVRQCANRSSPRVFALLNISTIGLIAETGESRREELCDAKLAAATIEAHREFFVGVKCRLDHRAVGEMGLLPLQRAIQAAEATALPVMVHIGAGPPMIDDVLSQLRPGDVLTHCMTGQSMALLDEKGRVRRSVAAARERGVLFDVGHGSGAFSFRVAEAMLAAGLPPDVISSDLHQRSILGPAFDLPTCLSKFLALGMSMEDVFAAATVNPARAVSLSESGRLDIGGCADIAIFEIEKGDFAFFDTDLVERHADRLLVNRATVMAGRLLPPLPPASPARWIETTHGQDALLAKRLRFEGMRRPWVTELDEAGDYVSYT